MEPLRDVDVVVIGVGQAGLSTAWALRRQGFRTIGANRAGQAAARALRRALSPTGALPRSAQGRTVAWSAYPSFLGIAAR